MLLSLSMASKRLARLINERVCLEIRGLLSYLSSVFRFSVFEILLFLSPLLLFFVIRYVTASKEKARERFVFLLALISLFPTLYILTLGISYEYPSPFAKYSPEVSEEALFRASDTLCEMINSESESFSEIPAFEFIKDEAMESFLKIREDFFPGVKRLANPKPLLTSRVFNYTGILAFYSYPTGEININTAVPSYTLPFTVSHELAHSVGFSVECDASFIAFLSAIKSESPVLRYSVFLSVLDYMLDDLKIRGSETAHKIYSSLSERAKADLKSFEQYSEKYEKNHIYKAFDNLNSMHLDAWDKNKRASYSLISRYVTNYLCSA